MTEKVTLRLETQLPMPLIHFASAEALADWYVSQMAQSLETGEAGLVISCFDPATMGLDVGKTAYTVLKAVIDFLYAHPQVTSLLILCGDEAAYKAYSFHWNMWYAAHKPGQGNG